METKMIKYREIDNITMKDEYEEIGWSVLDSSTIYRVKTTAFNISDGIISTTYWFANKDGTEYKASAYRNCFNGFTTIM